MTSIDDLFPKPNAPPKRKLDDPIVPLGLRNPNKSAKLNSSSSPHRLSNNKSAVIEDEVPDSSTDVDNDDVEAGPSLPPDDEADDDIEEDEEGRFFGGGVTKQEKQVLDYIDETGADDVEEKIDLAWLKRTALNFERKINKNAELRGKYENDPIKFVSSEADLDAEIKGLSLLSEHSDLYAEFVKSGCVGSLVSLLAHDNTDIAISVCEVLAELTDDDSGANEIQWGALLRAMVDNDIVDLLASNLGRLDEANDNDRAGVYHVLSVVENLLSERSAVDGIGQNLRMMKWLLSRIKSPDQHVRNKVGQNRQYAAELLAILLQNNEKNQERFASADSIETLLQLLSTWRRKDPEKDSDEEEFAENLFDCLISVVKVEVGAAKFLEGEGVELCLLMVKEGKFSRLKAISVLDHASGGFGSLEVCDRIVESGGLKTLFTAFMKSKKSESYMIEHCIGLFSNMLRYLPAESAARIRTLAKFVEKDYEKLVRLADLRRNYVSKVTAVNKQLAEETQAMKQTDLGLLEETRLSRRMDAGLFTLQALDLILAWLVAEDDGARVEVTELVSVDGKPGLESIRSNLQEQLDGIELEDTPDGVSSRDMLMTLLRFLE